MSKSSILQAPNPVLSQIAKRVDGIDGTVLEQAESLRRMVITHNFGGLAANQIGISRRIFAMRHRFNILVCINPEILEASTFKLPWPEGCCSLPRGENVWVFRSARISLKYTTPEGKICLRKLWGASAATAQHEMDHLNGILITDHRRLSPNQAYTA